MAHEIDMTNGQANIAFRGLRKDVWHRLGQEMGPGQSVEEWAATAGLAWKAVKVPALADITSLGIVPAGYNQEYNLTRGFNPVDGQKFIVRSDTGGHLGYVSDQYQPVQPIELLEWFERYVSVDDRFKLDVAGSLRDGRTVWATASFSGDITVVDDKHKAGCS
jgi:hypothetical protein